MGSSEWKFVAGGALAAALFVGFHFMVPGPNAAALKHDHTKKWSYVFAANLDRPTGNQRRDLPQSPLEHVGHTMRHLHARSFIWV